MIRRKQHQNWDGYIERDYEWDGIDRRQPQIIVEQPSQPEPSPIAKLFSGSMIPILYAIISGVFMFAWNQHDTIKELQFQQKQLMEKHTDHEKSDIEFKDQYKDVNKKLDSLKDQIQSIEQTVMSMYQSSKVSIKAK